VAEKKSSETAQGVSVLRAAHQLIDGEPRILDDPVIVRMLEEATRARILARPEEYQSPRLRALRSRLLVRSRFAEDRLEAAAARGLRQYVILGAGMDTFAYRQPAWARDLRIFELDQTASQAAKRSSLEVAGIPIPTNLEFVEADFEKDSLHSVLKRSSFDFAGPAFFSCLGVLMYLTEKAVHSILEFVASTPPSSEIVFSFANQDPLPNRPNQISVTERNATRLGEPWLTKFQPDVLERNLQGLGFSEILFLTPEMIIEQYLRDRQDGLPAPHQTSIVSAKV
jgi:methyltransferase (TIGR00027 family)